MRHFSRHLKDPSENLDQLCCPSCTQEFTVAGNWARHFESVHSAPHTSHNDYVHKSLLSDESDPMELDNTVEQCDWQMDCQGTEPEDADGRHKVAKFLLRLQCEHGLSKAATSDVASEIADLIDVAVQEHDESANGRLSVEMALKEFTSGHKLTKFCHKELCYVPPTTFVLTEGSDNCSGTYQYVDMKRQLTCLLENGTLDGCKMNYSIKLVIYFDEFGICNPLRNKATDYSLGAVYFAIDEGQSLSALSDIYLVLLCPTKLMKLYGMDTVMKPAVRSLANLLSDGVMACGEHFSVSVEFVAGDNLGIHKLAGFQESFSSGRRPCRTCYATNEEFNSKLTEHDLSLRTEERYREELKDLDVDGDDGALKGSGIKGKCVFDDLSGFKVTEMFPPDIAHDLFEGGVVSHTLALVLSYFIFQVKLLSLGALQKAMTSFTYVRSDRVNTPRVLQAKGRKVIVKGTFCQIWTLLRVVPFLLGSLVPAHETAWVLLMDLVLLVQFFCAPRMDGAMRDRMQMLVEKWLKDFRRTFPQFRFTPKFHYMLHYRHWASKVGSLRKSWTMRFEAKHQEFKMMASRAHNTKNVCKTLAVRHQEKKAACADAKKGTKSIGKKMSIYQVKAALGRDMPTDDSKTYSKMAVLSGQTYCADDVLVIRDPASSGSGDRLLQVIAFQFDDDVLLIAVIGRILIVHSFDKHHTAYKVRPSDQLMTVPPALVFDPCPLGVYSVNATKYVALRYQIPGLRILTER